jgi:hypothetical protein
MNPSLDHEIRDKLGSYLLGEFSLEDFKDWFVPVSWDVDHGNNQAAINLVYEIELRLAEYSDGYWSEDELKNLLRPLVENYRVELAPISDFQLGSNARVERWSLLFVSSHILSSGASL